MTTRADDVMRAYRRYRIDDQAAYYQRQAANFERALRRTTRISAILLVAASLCGALGAVDANRRGMWAFVATSLAALSTAVATYEVAFGFERVARQYAETLSALELAHAARPTGPDDTKVADHVALVERLLRSEVDSWSHLGSETASPPAENEGATGSATGS